MTTSVNLYAPYIMQGCVVRISQRSPTTGEKIGTETILSEANKVVNYTIHNGAMLLIEEVNAPPVVLPADPAPGTETAPTPADAVASAINGG